MALFLFDFISFALRHSGGEPQIANADATYKPFCAATEALHPECRSNCAKDRDQTVLRATGGTKAALRGRLRSRFILEHRPGEQLIANASINRGAFCVARRALGATCATVWAGTHFESHRAKF